MPDFKSERNQLYQVEKLYIEKDFPKALAMAEKAISEFPASFQLKLLDVKILKELGRQDDAEKLLLELKANYPDNINLLCELGEMYFARERYEESLMYFNKVLFLNPFHERAREFSARISDKAERRLLMNLEDTRSEILLEASANQPAEIPQVPENFFEEELLPEVEPAAAMPEPEEPPPLPFETESAADLYFQQGHWPECLAIYRKLHAKTGDSRLLIKIRHVEELEQQERQIRLEKKLNSFLHLIQQRSREFVSRNI